MSECEVCHKKFTCRYNLTIHSVVHTGEKAFKCDICQKKFGEKGTLKKHYILHAGEKPFECDICKQKFATKCVLTKHIKVHTGEKPFECNMCRKKFLTKSDLIRHIRVHTGEKLFQCNTCQKKFAVKRGLKDHKCRTNEKHFECKVCYKQFAGKVRLNKHIKMVHINECDASLEKSWLKIELTNHRNIRIRKKNLESNLYQNKFIAKEDISSSKFETNTNTPCINEFEFEEKMKVENIQDNWFPTIYSFAKNAPVERKCDIKIEHHELQFESFEKVVKMEKEDSDQEFVELVPVA